MEPLIRECRMEDAEFICELNRNEMGYDFPLEQTKQQLSGLLKSSKDKIYVAEIENHVVGYVHANDYDLLYALPMKNIMGIAVAGDYRKRGIGAALLSAVEKWAEQTGVSGVRLVSGASRTGAHEFYRCCGYGGEKEQVNFKKFFNAPEQSSQLNTQ